MSIYKQINEHKDAVKLYESAVGMSVYQEDNYEWLKQSVESILQQTEKNFVFLVVIDGPVSDETRKYLVNLYCCRENVLLFQSSENMGLSSAMNFLIDYLILNMSSVKYFFRMDADDVSEQNRLVEQIAFLEANNEVSVVGSSLVEINENGAVVGHRHLPAHHGDIYRIMPRRCAINHPTVCIKMDVFKQGFRYNTQLLNTQDYFLWIDLCASGIRFANITKSLLKFRRVNDFYKRRGLTKSINEFNARWHAMRSLDRVNLKNIIYAYLVIILRFMPAKLLKLAYRFDRYLMKRKKI